MSINFNSLTANEHLTKKHHSKPYQMWLRLKRSCENPYSPEYQNYGAKGMTICDEWSASFVSFWNDVSDTYTPVMTITVKDIRLPLSKRNVLWISPRKLQASHLCKPVAEICDEGLVIATYPSICAASKATGLHKSSIAKVVRGIWNHTSGRHFVKFYT
jgi:hypothetical protein